MPTVVYSKIDIAKHPHIYTRTWSLQVKNHLFLPAVVLQLVSVTPKCTALITVALKPQQTVDSGDKLAHDHIR